MLGQRPPISGYRAAGAELMAVDRVVVMGVSGSGKSTVGLELARRRGAVFVDGDELHPPSNVAKMAAGTPLTDEDRWPWLAAVRCRLRSSEAVVVACSALRRAYRDVLRGAPGVRFVDLKVDDGEARRRLRQRPGHFMKAGMVDSQFAALEAPAAAETDVAEVDATGPLAEVVARAEAALQRTRPGTAVTALLADGASDRVLAPDDVDRLVEELVMEEVRRHGARKVLLVPPDATRPHSGTGHLTGVVFSLLSAAGCDVAVVPAVGTHAAMDGEEAGRLFERRVPPSNLRTHRWRQGLAAIGEIGAAEVSASSAGRASHAVPVEVGGLLLGGWDLVVSLGQVVPHEVVGMANFTKNLVIGLGGAATIHATHLLSALCGIEAVMGRTVTPVRDVVDAAFDRFLAPRLRVLWLLTVMEGTAAGVVQRGVFAGRGGSGDSGGAAFHDAAALASQVNVVRVPEPLERVSCWLAPEEFRSTWLGNKAVYRTRMAIADGGELLVLAPGVTRFGEDAQLDRLIRRHGYRGQQAVLEAVGRDRDLARNLGAAAHLIHGSSEGRFRIVYCTDPASGGLRPDEVEAVGYEWRPLDAELARLGVEPSSPTGPRTDVGGSAFHHVAHPGLGLWTARSLEAVTDGLPAPGH